MKKPIFLLSTGLLLLSNSLWAVNAADILLWSDIKSTTLFTRSYKADVDSFSLGNVKVVNARSLPGWVISGNYVVSESELSFSRVGKVYSVNVALYTPTRDQRYEIHLEYRG